MKQKVFLTKNIIGVGKVFKLGLLPIFALVSALLAWGQQSDDTEIDNSCIAVIGSVESMSPAEMREALRRTNGKHNLAADLHFQRAEILKRLGNYAAVNDYEKAIDTDTGEPCYESFYADYMRAFRGAGTPLFSSAEKHYFLGLKKVRLRNGGQHQRADEQTKDYIYRGLSALYEQDGVAVLRLRSDNPSSSDEDVKAPYGFFSSVDRYAQSTADLDREADIRDYTSEALFAESASRLNRQLTVQELKGLVRTKKAAETRDRLRFRYKSLPVLDFSYTHRQTADDQVTNFFKPNEFNDLRLSQYGVTLQKPFSIANQFDVSLTGGFEVDQRWGLIEFAPGSEERILNYQARGAISRFFGPDKATVEFTFVHQSIHPETSPISSDRSREFIGGRATYSIFRRLPFLQPAYDKRFQTRGWDVFYGYLGDTETFPPATVRRRDYFVGTSLKGLWRFDFTVQPTWFTSTVNTDPTQHNGQFRTNIITLFRVVDEERKGGLPSTRAGTHLAFLHLVVPYKQDTAFVGTNAFENSTIGAELDAKLFTYARWTTILLSTRYEHQQFNQLGMTKNLFRFDASIGF